MILQCEGDVNDFSIARSLEIQTFTNIYLATYSHPSRFERIFYSHCRRRDALHRSLGISKATASFAVVVEAIDDDALRFYQRFDFQAFPDRAFKLFRTMTNIGRALDRK